MCSVIPALFPVPCPAAVALAICPAGGPTLGAAGGDPDATEFPRADIGLDVPHQESPGRITSVHKENRHWQTKHSIQA